MSFRARLTSFFVLIVVVPMAAVGFLVFRLIDDSQAAKADARADGIAATAQSVYAGSSLSAGLDARALARDIADLSAGELRARIDGIARQAGLARVTVVSTTGLRVTVGNLTAVAPGVAVLRASGSRPRWTIEASELTAADYARSLRGAGIQVVVRSGTGTLASTLPASAHVAMPARRGAVSIGDTGYRAATQDFVGFDGSRVRVSVLSEMDRTTGSLDEDRLLAGAFIAAFLVLAFFFALLASRALQAQIGRFLEAARRLGSGDFSSPIATHGRDEFAALGEEFNSMSRQLAHRLDELEAERARVGGAIRRIGEAFASGLDRPALIALSLRTAMDATGADRGRVSARESESEPLAETLRVGALAGLETPILAAERDALDGDGGRGDRDGIGEAVQDDMHVIAIRLGAMVPGGPTHGMITVAREGRRFTADDVELLRSLAARATLALANVNLHLETQRQAVTDDLTGLASHGHFQDILGDEMEQVRRYRYPVGLIMLDIDDFKSVNDAFGHQQGDLVLRSVAEVLRDSSRDVDLVARYGGEEMAVVLPHTDLEGTYEMAERARTAIEATAVPRLDGAGALHVTSSFGVACTSDGDQGDLIAAADSALYDAKRTGKNRTVCAQPQTANVSPGE